MSLEQISSNKCHDGLQLKFSLSSFVLNCAMTFSVYGQYVNKVLETDYDSEFTFSWNLLDDTLVSIGSVSDSNASLYGWNYVEFKKYDANYDVLF